MIVLKDNKAKFGIDFNENKNVLDSLSTISSKSLRNRVAGYITRLLKNESIELEKAENIKKQEQTEEQFSEDTESTKDELKSSEIETATPELTIEGSKEYLESNKTKSHSKERKHPVMRSSEVGTVSSEE